MERAMRGAGVKLIRIAALAVISFCMPVRSGADVLFDLVLERKGYPDFDSNPVIDARPGSVHLINVDLTISPSGYRNGGVQGWSLALWHAGMDLVSTTTEGTVSADKSEGGLVDIGFVSYQVIDPARNGGRRGVVQAIVLSQVRPVFLESDKPNVVGRHVYQAQVQAEGVGAFLRYADGLRGRGEPVLNASTIEGNTLYPQVSFREISIGANVVPEAGACADGIDNDHDTWTDCDDPDCHDFAACGFELCADGMDNDGDMRIDCTDVDCSHDENCHENCVDGIDNDHDGAVDCVDFKCASLSPCTAGEDCTDGIDNDNDGAADCHDFECFGLGDCPGTEICGDNIDNDLDGIVDCEDPQCFGILPCLGLETCGDGIDNNGDQKADCDDPQCIRFGSCVGSEDCDDGADNDGDGKVDCDDPQCGGVPPCQQLEICGDGIDNDADGKTDCDDPQCEHIPPCPGPEDCNDRFDNDQDGYLDCDDPDCAGTRECPPREDCSDGIDNDGDLRADCEDPECRGHLACPASEVCNDGVDNDQDGRADCADSDCETAAVCGADEGFDLVLVADGSRFSDGRSVVDVDKAGDGKVAVTVYVVPFPGPQPDGVQGWSLSIAHDRRRLGFDPDGGAPSFASTDAATLFRAGFQKTEVAKRFLGPDENVDGFVSAIVLSFTQPVTLDSARAQSVVHAGYRVLGGVASATWISTLIRFFDGLRGSGQPVSNRLTALGQSRAALHLVPLEVRLGTVAGAFVRGDSNSDHKADIADAVWCINELLRHGPRTLCQRAADINDDGLYDLSDVMYLISWEFLSGPAIPPPFPECAAALGPSELECPEGSVDYCKG
jgi:hypothetical protein